MINVSRKILLKKEENNSKYERVEYQMGKE